MTDRITPRNLNITFNANVPAAVSITVIVGGICFIAWKHPTVFTEIVNTIRCSLNSVQVGAIPV